VIQIPYIEKGRREPLGGQCRSIGSSLENHGQLNFAITQILVGWLGGYKSYEAFNAVMGTLDCVAREFYRRVVAPYEEEKKKASGDVY